MKTEQKRQAIIRLYRDKVFDAPDKRHTQASFAKDILDSAKSSFQRILKGEAQDRSVVNVWENLKKNVNVDDDTLYFLSRVKVDYEAILEKLGSKDAVYDWVEDFWYYEKQPVIENGDLPYLPTHNLYLSIFLAYSFYRLAPDVYCKLNIGQLNMLFWERFKKQLPILFNSSKKEQEKKFGVYKFTLLGMVSCITGILVGIKTLNKNNSIQQPWDYDTCWINLSETRQGSKPKTFYLFKILEGECYLIIKSELNRNDTPKIEICGTAVIGQLAVLNEQYQYIAIHNGDIEKHEMYDLDLSKTNKMVFRKGNEIISEFEKVDIYPDKNGMYRNAWSHIIHKTVESKEFMTLLCSEILQWSHNFDKITEMLCQVDECIKTREYFYFRMDDRKQRFWMKIDLSLHPMLKDIQPNKILLALKSGDSYDLHLQENNNFSLISLGEFETLTNEAMVKELGLDK